MEPLYKEKDLIQKKQLPNVNNTYLETSERLSKKMTEAPEVLRNIATLISPTMKLMLVKSLFNIIKKGSQSNIKKASEKK